MSKTWGHIPHTPCLLDGVMFKQFNGELKKEMRKESLIMKKILVFILMVLAIVGASHLCMSLTQSPIPQFSDEMMEMICIEEGI